MWPYGLLPAGNMGKRVRVPCVYNSQPWVILKLTINDMATLWDVPLLLQEKLEEPDKKSLLVQFLSSVPGKTLLLASDYLISLRIRGGWCSMSCIYPKVEVQDTVIKQVLSTLVPLNLPTMEYEMAGAILKADGQNEDDASPPVVLWDSCFYISYHLMIGFSYKYKTCQYF